MKSQFDYYRADSIEHAISLKNELGTDAYYWAGGTDLVLQWNHEKIHPLHCIDLTSISGFNFISNHEGLLRIGALTTLSEIEHADTSDAYLHTLAYVTSLMATQQTRTIATIAGNLCNASPAADLLPPLIAMGAYLKVSGNDGERQLPVENLLVSPGRTSLKDEELVTEICIPTDTKTRASSYRRIDRTVVDISLVGASGALTLDDNQMIATAKIALGSVAPTVIRSSQAEAMLGGKLLTDLDDDFLKAVGEAAAADATPISDVRASAEYRKAMVKVLVIKVLRDIVAILTGDEND